MCGSEELIHDARQVDLEEMIMTNETPMYLVPGRLTVEQREMIYRALYSPAAMYACIAAIGTPIQPCADVETVGAICNPWTGQINRHVSDVFPIALVRRTDMEVQVARVAAEKDAEIAELKRLIQIIAFPVKNDIGTEWSGTPPIYAERDGLHMVRDRRTGYLKIIRWYIQWDGRGQLCSMSEDDSIRLYDRYIGPVFCAALNEGAAG